MKICFILIHNSKYLTCMKLNFLYYFNELFIKGKKNIYVKVNLNIITCRVDTESMQAYGSA